MDIPALVKSTVRKIDKDCEVILFGSRARGDARQSSDWDFLILLKVEPTKETKDAIIRRLYDLELQTDEVIASIIHHRKAWEDMAVTPIYQSINKEGIRI